MANIGTGSIWPGSITDNALAGCSQPLRRAVRQEVSRVVAAGPLSDNHCGSHSFASTRFWGLKTSLAAQMTIWNRFAETGCLGATDP